MSELEGKQNPNSIYWQAESFRLTAFLSPSAQIVEQDSWKKLTGELPERKTSEPRTGIRQEEGRFKDERVDGQLVLITQPTRADWQLVPITDVSDPEFPTLGLFTESVDSFLKLMIRWLEEAPPTQRLAFGAVLIKPVNSSKEGYEWVSAYLPFNLDENSSDFSYQINRPRKSASTKTSDLSINRLSKWSVSLLTSFAFDPSRLEQYITKPPRFSVRLELDINTTPNFSEEVGSEKLSHVFQELVELGREIASKGDIK
ncbi:MAG: hypothetical protein H7126_02485 [Candidatus Parcubacteria bacterium]|uniref:hypothetical protein n=1 Tax=Phormidesmis priestleyi TaxID=268141 RepID=UPI000839ECEF|nr:hypothetical protein [Phormidesmis priestleyi]MBC7822744.1 hypothetical protein [Leptolyngbyaceae cyanobacterium LF-bin-113]